MYSFLNDYSEGAWPPILSALAETNLQQHPGYGTDPYSREAAELLLAQTRHPESRVFFVSGGTQANLICLDALLRPVEAVMCAETGHIWVNEAGAIEATGHKVVPVPAEHGKVSVAALERTLAKFQFQPHVVRIKAVYLSQSTEVGTLYTRAELEAIAAFCRQEGLYLMVDGARLGCALAAESNDLSLADLARLTDIFWLGGTKMGALFGEAVVVNHPEIGADFALYLKQHGALLAKGRVLGLQFLTLLKNDAYLTLCRHANTMAARLGAALEAHGCTLAHPVESNQVFAVVQAAFIPRLRQEFDFYEWEQRADGTSVLRLVTSWATQQAQAERFVRLLAEIAAG